MCGKVIVDTTTNPKIINDFLTVEKEWGYFSNIFADEENHEFALCEECYANLISKFKYIPNGFKNTTR
jgi:hypothetical protein